MIKKNILEKKKCICGNKLNKKINFGKLPLINDFKKSKTKKYPTILTQCSSCYLVQLKYSVKDSLIFPKNYSYLSADSKEKIYDYKSLISKLSSNYKQKNKSIVDIGGNDGSLMLIAKKRGYSTLNIEPTNVSNLSRIKGIKTINKKFSNKIAKEIIKKQNKFDFVVSTNFFAHTNDLKAIINGVKKILKDNGTLVIEVQYLYKVLKSNGFDSFHQDHKYYYTLNSIQKILKYFDLYIFDAEFLNKQSEIIRIYVNKKFKKKTLRCLNILKSENDKLVFKKIERLNKFRIKHISKIKRLISLIVKKKKKICGISASPRGCVLLNSANFGSKKINFIGEMPQSFKLKKLIPGTDIEIKEENQIVKNQPDFVIILAWHLKSRLIKFLKKKGYKGKFIVPLPKIKIS